MDPPIHIQSHLIFTLLDILKPSKGASYAAQLDLDSKNDI
jgi:hypothetical protein